MCNAPSRAHVRKLAVLAGLALLAAVLYLLVDVNFGNEKLLRFALRLRTPKLIAMLITAFAIGGASIVLSLAACGNPNGSAQTTQTPDGSAAAEAPETITIPSLNANKEEIELEVPADPQRLSVLDMASLDILDQLGLGGRVVGSASTSLDYLQDYVTDDSIANLGTIKEADLEAVMACELGFENIGVDAEIDTSSHGNEASFELIVDKNPDYIFVMDRDAAIGTAGAQLAKEIVENELIMGTDAYRNGNIVYLVHPAVWYTAEGGIHALDLMLQDMENALLQ